MKTTPPARPWTALPPLLLSVAIGCSPSPPMPDVVGGNDAGDVVSMDSGPADVTPTDTGGSRHRPRPGCNADAGIECDGDWEGQCDPPCAAEQCCSPQGGQFACVDPGPDGYCPAADLSIDPTKITGHYRVDWQYFPPGDCAVQERCVNAAGWRRLLRFATWTPNTGGADMYLGRPNRTNPNFEYSDCHEHFHFNTYADYRLRRMDGTEAAAGHKQAFCLLDFYRNGTTDGMGAHYTCDNQGIQMGWQDVYGSDLDCQWVDVTDVPEGTYNLHIAINIENILNESDYSNNAVDVPVTVPADDSMADPTRPCASSTEGVTRNCGWTREGVHECTAGQMVTLGCSAACGVGSCTGDTMLRVYEGDRPAMPWDVRAQLASNDDSGCARNDLCSRVQFMCPASGRYTVLTGSFNSGQASTCNVMTAP